MTSYYFGSSVPAVIGIFIGFVGLVFLPIFWPLSFLFFLTAAFILLSMKIIPQWQRVVVLRLGRFQSVLGPGIFFIIPLIDSVAYNVDLRTVTNTFKAEQTLTKDNVPVSVDAVLFWKILDPKKAALEVESYFDAVTWASQTALRDIIGTTMLSDLLIGRQRIDAALKQIIDERTEPWGITVASVELRDIIIPRELQDAMSRQAQAEREKQARVILAESEVLTAQKFRDAAKIYGEDPISIKLRSLNLLYEATKEKGTFIIVPTEAAKLMGDPLALIALSEAEKLKKKTGK